MSDLRTENHGSIVLLRPLTPEGENWLSENTEGAMHLGSAIAVEPRYVREIVEGAMLDGLEVE